MSQNIENTIRENQLTFIGKLLAGYTHELKNHLAIINESNGLMSDLLEMKESADDPISQKFIKRIAAINTRISLANNTAKYLNGFAHRMDEAASNFNVNNLLTGELALIERVARLKSVQFKPDFQEGMPSVYNNASLFQLMIFTLIDELIGRLTGDSSIEIVTHEQDHMIHIDLEAVGKRENEPEAAEADTTAAILRMVSEKINVGVNRLPPTPDRLKIGLTLPMV